MEKLQCEICGGNLTMAEDGENAVCESCGMRFKKEIIKKMVMEFTGPIKIDGSVQVEGIENADTLTKRASDFEKLGMNDSARSTYEDMTRKYPGDYRGWMGVGQFAARREDRLPALQKALKLVPAEMCGKAGSLLARDAANISYDSYHDKITALHDIEDARSEEIAEAKAKLAGANRENEMGTRTQKSRKAASACFAVIAVICFLAQHIIFIILGVLAGLIALMCLAGSTTLPFNKWEISEMQQNIDRLEKEAVREDIPQKIAAIPIPDGSDSPDSTAFREQFEIMRQADIDKRQEQLKELQNHYDFLMKKESIGRDNARFCNHLDCQRVCDVLKISRYNKEYYKFILIYGNTVELKVTKNGENGKVNYFNRTDRCGVFVDGDVRTFFN